MYLGASWSWIGPYCLWYYEIKVIPQFWKEIAGLFQDTEQFEMLRNQFERTLFKRHWPFMIIWAFAVLFAFHSLGDFMVTLGLHGVSDVAFWGWLLFISFLAILSGYGFAGVFNSINIIKAVATSDFRMDQYHHDGCGGLSCVGGLTLFTVLLFSSGSVFVPILVTAANFQGVFVSVSVLLLILLFCVSIFVGFIYPLLVIRHRFLDMRNRCYAEFKDDARKSLQPDHICQSSDVCEQLRILNLRNLYVDLARMTPVPINMKFLAEMVFFVFLPFFMVLLQNVLLRD